jgi:GNAT superfamily N-acetyltransferase
MRIAERISVERWHSGDEPWRTSTWDETATGCYAVYRAAHLTDVTDEPPESAGVFGLELNGWGHNPGEVWYVPAEAVPGGEAVGAVAAFYRIDLPDLENLDRAELNLRVHPALRRRGLGGALLRHAAQRAAADDRAILGCAVPGGSSGEWFLRSAGATLELEEVRRFQVLRTIAPGRIAELRAAAERAAAGYELVRWTGPIPDERCGQVAELYNAMNDAPRGENVQEETYDADRIRERTGKALRYGVVRGYAVAAMHQASGEMAGLTEVVIDPGNPDWGFQQLTAVTRPHRGHRLGMLVKTAMLEWLAEAEPQLEQIETGNAATNEHMIAVNETLGYHVAEPGWSFFDLPVAKVLGTTVPGTRVPGAQS